MFLCIYFTYQGINEKYQEIFLAHVEAYKDRLYYLSCSTIKEIHGLHKDFINILKEKQEPPILKSFGLISM